MALLIRKSMDFSILFTNSVFLIGKKKLKYALFNSLSLQNNQRTKV